MTSTNADSTTDWEDPLMPLDWNEEKERQLREERARVRERHVAVFSSSPLYQARAAKDPAYWQTFSAGGIR